MQRPKYGKRYVFVRLPRAKGEVREYVYFSASDDGTGGCEPPTGIAMLDGDWSADLERLRKHGFVEVGDAMRAGRLPPDWTLPRDAQYWDAHPPSPPLVVVLRYAGTDHRLVRSAEGPGIELPDEFDPVAGRATLVGSVLCYTNRASVATSALGSVRWLEMFLSGERCLVRTLETTPEGVIVWRAAEVVESVRPLARGEKIEVA